MISNGFITMQIVDLKCEISKLEENANGIIKYMNNEYILFETWIAPKIDAN